MPVHEIRYQTWQGEVLPSALRLLAIPRFTLLATFNKFIAIAMFSGCIQLLAYTGYLLITTNPLISKMLNLQTMNIELLSPAKILRNFYLVQFFICVVVSALSGPKMISPELQHNALPMIYSRPLSRTGYITGKFMGIGLLLSALTWVQAIILFVLMMVIYPSEFSFWKNFWTAPDGSLASIYLFPKALLMGMALTLCLGLFALACSSATKNFLHAGILFFVILFGSSFVTVFIQEAFNMASFPDLGLREIFDSLGAAWFNGQFLPGSSYFKIGAGMLMWIGACYFFMRWRLRPVDVYKE